MQPLTPEASTRMLDQLGCAPSPNGNVAGSKTSTPDDERGLAAITPDRAVRAGTRLPPAEIVFPRIDIEAIDAAAAAAAEAAAAAAGVTPPAPAPSSAPVAPLDDSWLEAVSDVEGAVREQGDLVRQLKAAKAGRVEIAQQVAKLVKLKSRLVAPSHPSAPACDCVAPPAVSSCPPPASGAEPLCTTSPPVMAEVALPPLLRALASDPLRAIIKLLGGANLMCARLEYRDFRDHSSPAQEAMARSDFLRTRALAVFAWERMSGFVLVLCHMLRLAASAGCVGALEELVDNRQCALTVHVCAAAAGNGQLGALIWLRSHGYPWDFAPAIGLLIYFRAEQPVA
ncbi:hypothetical protein T492DRAFT_876094 [Pavlovales sp. CCMP2436]|nr:hypothetical protein T492DRAFT_876094 [Pavlovales sp. CCMP2436]